MSHMNNTPIAKLIARQIQEHKDRKYQQAIDRKQYDIQTGIETNPTINNNKGIACQIDH